MSSVSTEEQEQPVFKLCGRYLGHGAFGTVYRAVETNQRIHGDVALKKSRVSLQRKRTILKHESRILQLLQGHPAIPAVYAYGRFEHFEYIAMELLGPSVDDLNPHPRGTPLKTVLLLADQMLSALEYIHSCAIIHRDVKPDNMLISLDDPNCIRLIDFGIAVQCPSGTPTIRDPIAGRTGIVGTINWVSVNGSYGMQLSRRDDLESLAYNLLFLIRGDLPWRSTIDHRDGTVFGTMIHVREQKQRWSGTTLAEGYPTEFGQFLDYTRTLGFEQVPDYSRFRDMFKELYLHSNFADNRVLDWCPTESSFSQDEWLSPRRPAVVVHSAFNSSKRRHEVKVAALKCGGPPDVLSSIPTVMHIPA